MSNDADVSILTQNGVEAHAVKRGNDYWGSLAALYDQTWLSQDPRSVFKLVPVIRDTERRIPELVPDVYVRDEYCKMLSSILSRFSEGFGDAAGYKHDISKSTANTETFPPHNPFENVDIKAIEEALLLPGVIVIGTPGIGKTLFLLYVLALRLLARQTTILQFNPNEFLIFEEAGVFYCTKMKDYLLFLPEQTWFLVDSNRDNKEPPTSFLNACVTFSRKIIMTASSRKERFTFLSKYENFIRSWMQCCLKEEVIAIRGSQWGKGFLKEHQLGYFFDEFGPNVRSAFRYSADPDSYGEWIKADLSNMNWESFRSMVRKLSAGYFETDFSHRILIAEPSNESRRDHRVEFASKSVAKLALETHAKAEHEKSLELLRIFLGSPKARESAGTLLQVIVEKEMLEGGAFRLSKMKKMLKRKSQRNDQQAAVWDHDPDSKPYMLLIGDQDRPVNIVEGDHSARPGEEFHKVKRVAIRHDDIKIHKEDTISYPGYLRDQVAQAPSEGFEWYDNEVKQVDVVVVSDEEGGNRVEIAAENAGKIE